MHNTIQRSIRRKGINIAIGASASRNRTGCLAIGQSSFMTTRLFLVGSLCTACLFGQGPFVYTNNNTEFANSVSAFSVTANGALVAVPGSPFPTGGNGNVVSGLFASNRITTGIVKDFLYAGNSGSNNVTVIDAPNKALIAVKEMNARRLPHNWSVLSYVARNLQQIKTQPSVRNASWMSARLS